VTLHVGVVTALTPPQQVIYTFYLIQIPKLLHPFTGSTVSAICGPLHGFYAVIYARSSLQ